MKFFYYTRKEKVQKPQVNGEDQPEEFTEYTDLFNTDYVIRGIALPNGGMIIVLDDFHPETRTVPVLNKQQKYTRTKNETNTVCSEIFLSKEDAERFTKN